MKFYLLLFHSVVFFYSFFIYFYFQDIFEAQDENGNEIVLKIHRLGRTSFRAVRRNRDYMQGKSKASWLFMSRLAGKIEY